MHWWSVALTFNRMRDDICGGHGPVTFGHFDYSIKESKCAGE